MAFSIGWLLDKLGQKMYAWSTTNAVMDFDRGGEAGQTLQKTLDDLEGSKGDMRKDVFATNGKPGVVDNAVNGINTYIHSKQGAVHNFQGEGSNGKALMTANFEEGDSITVNGVPVTAYIGTDEAVASMAGNEWNGKWITFTFEGSTLNFKGGGGGKVVVSGLSADKILNDTTITVKQGTKIIANTKGTIQQQGQKVVTANTQNQQFGPGIYLSGPLVVAGDPNLIANNIRKGTTIFGIEGTLTWEDLLPERVVGQTGATIKAEFLGGLSNTSQGSINSNGISPGYSGNVAFCFTKPIDTNIYQAIEFKIGTVKYTAESSILKVGISSSANINYNSFSAVKQFTGIIKTGNVYRCDLNAGTSGYVKFASWNAEVWVIKTTLIKR